MKHLLKLTLLVAFLATATGCGKGQLFGSEGESAQESLSQAQSVSELYAASDIYVDVAYEPGAEPYTNNLLNGNSIWSITKENMEALVQSRAHKPLMHVPTSLSAMTALPAQNKSSWTNEEIYNLALDNGHGTGNRLFVMFLRGNFNDNGTVKTDILGVQITGTSVIAIFKDAVTATGSGPTVMKYMEQATVVHEIGHVMGLVNHGVPLTSEHHDHEHGAHCSNPSCVMNWINQGNSSFMLFMQNAIENGNRIMFGDECLSDTNAY